MPNIKVKNYFGNDVILNDVEKVTFSSADGNEHIPFSCGDAVENVPISLDFSNGDQLVFAPAGTLVKSAIIEKPETLIPENIADGIVVAGIPGKHKGGGGGAPLEIVTKLGHFTADATGAVCVKHDLGVLPDFIYIANRAAANAYLISSVAAVCDELAFESYTQACNFFINTNGSSMTSCPSGSIYDPNGEVVHGVTPRTFMVGGDTLKVGFGNDIDWIAFGGLIPHKYIDVVLSLDGEGHLIMTGGVPEFEQVNVYVDGVIAKTVDYVHGDEFIIDISDVAGEFAREYKITVEGVGDAIESTYPITCYSPVVGYTVSISGACGDSVNYRLRGDGLLEIYGTGAMYDCTIASDNVTIDQPWFSHRSMIKSVEVKDGVTRIGNQSLRGLTNMTSVDIANTVTHIGVSAFLGDTGLSSITIPPSVVRIENYAFNEVTTIKDVYYLGNIDQWLSLSFQSSGSNPCYNGRAKLYISGNLITDVTISKETLLYGTFAGCSSLVSVTFASDVRTIGKNMFLYCENLKNVTLEEGITKIKDYAFEYCKSITGIIIPNSVTMIGAYAFYGCSALKTAYFIDATTWYASNSETSTSGTKLTYGVVSNETLAAEYLKITYAKKWWHKT